MFLSTAKLSSLAVLGAVSISATQGVPQDDWAHHTSQVQHAYYVTVATEERPSSRRQTGKVSTERELIRELKRLHEEYRASRARKTPPVFGSPIFGPSTGQNFVRQPNASHAPKETPTSNRRKSSSRRAPAKPPTQKAKPIHIRSPYKKFKTQIRTNKSAFIPQVQAEHHFHRGDFSRAVSKVNRAMLYDDTNAQLKMFSALAELANQNYRVAGQRFRQGAKQLNFFEWSFVYDLHDQLYGKNEFQDHIQGLDQFCNQFPNELDAIRFRGFLSFIDDDMDAAIEDFETILSADSNDVVVNQIFQVASQFSAQQ